MHARNLIKFYNYIDYPIRYSKFKLFHKDQRREVWNRLSNSKRYVDILSYCLMPNHFHLLVKQNVDLGISKLISNFQNSYTKYFNIRNDRIGPLLQGQFKAVKIESEEQLLHVSRYIHLNPYSSGLVGHKEELKNYKWSSFPEYLRPTSNDMCQKEDVLNNFKKPMEYQNFVLDNADYQKELEDFKHLSLE